jgi:hypothetical protein
MKWFIATLMFLFTIPTFAAVEVDTRGLTDAQKATLVQQAEQMKNDTKAVVSDPGKVAEVAEKWANIGERFGKMLGSAAKELGIAANDFLKTPVGMMTATVIVFHYMGGPIIHLSVGLLLMIVGLSLMTWIARSSVTTTIVYDETKRKWFGLGGFPVKTLTRGKLSDDIGPWILIGYLLTFIVSIWTMFAW